MMKVLYLLLSLLSIITSCSNNPKNDISEIKVQLAYPITSLNPSFSKDWQTVFISNHIYPRLAPIERDKTVPYIGENINFECISPKNSALNQGCKKVRFSFQYKKISDCMEREVPITQIQKELEATLYKMPWMIPNWKKCSKRTRNNTVCYEGDYLPDVKRRIHAVGFRFGWALQNKKAPLYGSGPYCLTKLNSNKRGITEGYLTPKKANLPPIHFSVSQKKEKDFHFALYGSKKLLKGSRKNIQAHTPIGYYVVTHPRHVNSRAPWNSKDTQDLIQSVFMKEGVYFTASNNITKIFPSGGALNRNQSLDFLKEKLEFSLPDYLPQCQDLSTKLNKLWNGKATAVCKDIVSFVMEKVWAKSRDWDGFIVGVTQHDPGRNAVAYEYFSPDSPESWVYDYPQPEKLYYLSGLGQSLVTVDGHRFCGIKPNILGLGGIIISDLISCKN